MTRFAFSTLACPEWDFATIAARAKEFGYDGVEIRGYLDESTPAGGIAANLFLSDPARVREIFQSAGVAIACLTSGVSMGNGSAENESAARRIRNYVDAAAALGCGVVRVRDRLLPRGRGLLAGAAELGQWLSPLGDYAGARGVKLAVGNSLTFRTAHEMWQAMEAIAHRSVGVAWDAASAFAVGESPSVSVPGVGGHFAYITARGAKLTREKWRAAPTVLAPAPLGQGDVPLRLLLTRLMGIGYTGWISAEWDRATHRDLSAPEIALPAALARLREWTRPPAPAKAAKPVHAR